MKTENKKNYLNKFLLAVLSLFILSTCDNFLAEDPKNFINPEEFYTTQEDAEGGLTGVYAILRSGGLFAGNSDGIIFMNHKNSEYTWPWSMDSPDVGYINYSPSYKSPINIWRDTYDGIKRTNNFIENLEGVEVDFPEPIKNQYIGEAKFLRALMYYYLVQFFGDVPLVTESFEGGSDYFVERNNSDEVWEFVKHDLNYSINNLPQKSQYSGSDISRASKGAAQTLLAKVHMILEEWAEAKQLIDSIIESGEYSLESDIVENWRTDSEHGPESIFEIQFASGFSPGMGNSLFQLSGPANFEHPITGNIVGGLWTGVAYSPEFFNSFEDEDLRKKKLFLDPETHAGPVGRYFTGKYFDPNVMFQGQWLNGPVNVVLFRYADVLLMKAEVENEVNNGPNVAAYDAIDQVRDRVNASKLDQNLSYNQFLDAVFDERAKELFYEGHRFFDLKRRGFEFLKNRVEPNRLNLFDYVGHTGSFEIQEYMLKLPIPINEMDANPHLTQNPGY